MVAQRKGSANSLPRLKTVTVVTTSSRGKSDGQESSKGAAILELRSTNLSIKCYPVKIHIKPFGMGV